MSNLNLRHETNGIRAVPLSVRCCLKTDQDKMWWVLDDESPTSANLGNDHEFIIKRYSLHWNETFWENPKQNHESLYLKWTISYHCGESCSSNSASLFNSSFYVTISCGM